MNDGGKDFRVIRRDLDHPAGAVAQGDRYSDGKAGITGLRVDDILPDYRYAVAVIFPAFLGFHLFEGFGKSVIVQFLYGFSNGGGVGGIQQDFPVIGDSHHMGA